MKAEDIRKLQSKELLERDRKLKETERERFELVVWQRYRSSLFSKISSYATENPESTSFVIWEDDFPILCSYALYLAEKLEDLGYRAILQGNRRIDISWEENEGC